MKTWKWTGIHKAIILSQIQGDSQWTFVDNCYIEKKYCNDMCLPVVWNVILHQKVLEKQSAHTIDDTVWIVKYSPKCVL